MEYTSTVAAKKYLTRDIVELALKITGNVEFVYLPGQYAEFLLDYTFRSYSMVTVSKNGKVVTFLIKLVPDGIGSEYVQTLQVGHKLRLRAPYGSFVLDNTHSDLLCVATGVGIAPVAAIIQHQLSRNIENNITLLFGLRSETDIFYHEEFQKLANKHQNFSFIPVLSQPKGEWKGERGRVTHYISAHRDMVRHQLAFICGSQAMIVDARDILIKCGLSKENIKTEVFY
jgi:NAD(P)H-flavin reductase